MRHSAAHGQDRAVSQPRRTASARSAPLVLVVDDEEPIRDLVRSYLRREGMEVISAADGMTALANVREDAPDVVILDLMLPGLDGIEVDRVVGLSIGADDYLVKPFSPRELVARVKALLRRPRLGSVSDDTPAGLTVDPQRHAVTVDGRRVSLTILEFDLLAALAREPGIVLSRQQLLDRVWGIDFVGDDHLLDVHVAKLRRKLGDRASDPRFVETVRGVGFRLVDR
jgi:DNA-binding response OmpR family regulator